MYEIYLNDELVGRSDWPPVAQAAWDRAARDRDSAQHGGEAALWKDGQKIASVQPRTGAGHPWPDQATEIVGLRDLAAAILQLSRIAGADARVVAEKLTEMGMPTNPARLKSIAATESGRRTATTPAELVSLCYAAIGALKRPA